jgi:hypothetical protein
MLTRLSPFRTGLSAAAGRSGYHSRHPDDDRSITETIFADTRSR